MLDMNELNELSKYKWSARMRYDTGVVEFETTPKDGWTRVIPLKITQCQKQTSSVIRTMLEFAMGNLGYPESSK